MKHIGISVTIFTDEWELTFRAVSDVVRTAVGYALNGTDATLKFNQIAAALEAEQV